MKSIIKKYGIYLLFVVSISLFCYKKLVAKKNTGITYKLTKQQQGWGYQILVNDTLVINQTNIPGVPGTAGFINEDEATCIAKKVVYKLQVSKQFPVITPQDLDSCHISNPNAIPH